jgi:signal transduction histidine kinase
VEKGKEELEQQSLLVIHHEQDRERILKKHQQQLNVVTGPTHLEKEIVLWNGKHMWIELSNSLLQLPGQPPLLLSIFRDISRRKAAEAELQETHRKLLDISRQAGMAEVATGVLHNVGNVLNSVNVSATLVADALKHSKTSSLRKAANLLREQSDVAQFFANDPRARELPGYLAQLAQHLGSEQELMMGELQSLQTNIGHIKDIVAMQQNYAKVSGVTEKVTVDALVEDALRMNEAALIRHDVKVVRNFTKVPPIIVDKHKVLQILVNLIRNAKYACDDAQRADKQVVVRIGKNDLNVFIDIVDNGVGIPKSNLTRIFEHGFTTRKNGHGFGLHSGALAARELGGALRVLSEGPGCGATFTIELPFHPPQALAA